MVSVHRYVHELLVGPIPDGYVLDHLCSVTLCCNPAHTEPVVQSVNVRRGRHAAAQRARRTVQAVCDSGRHAKVEIGRCAECNRERCKRWRDKRKAAL